MNVKRESCVVWSGGWRRTDGVKTSQLPSELHSHSTSNRHNSTTQSLSSKYQENLFSSSIEEREINYIILSIIVTSWNSGKNNVLPSN